MNMTKIMKYSGTGSNDEIISGKVVLKVGDNISTDHIVPSDSKLLPYRFTVKVDLSKRDFIKETINMVIIFVIVPSIYYH